MTETTKKRAFVVGMDLEEVGDVALMHGVRLASASGSELHVVHVIPLQRDTEVLAEELERAMEQLRERVAALTVEAPIDIHLEIYVGDPADTLHQFAVDVDADLLIVGTHARRGVARVVLGSVAEKLVRTAQLPVLVARDKDFEGLEPSPTPDEPRPGVPLSDGRRHLSRIIHVGPKTPHISGLL